MKHTINRFLTKTPAVFRQATGLVGDPPNPLDGGRSPTLFQNWPSAIAAIVLALICAHLIKTWLKARSDAQKTQPAVLNESDLTQSFVSSLPTLTRELNLEVATSTQTEVFERSDGRTLLWGLLDLGTNVARIRLDVTYRFHIRITDPWRLVATNQTLVVFAPAIRASLPPAIHTDRMEVYSARGWARFAPAEMVDQMRRDLTPALSGLAQDDRRIALVREACRQSVTEFVLRWLDGMPVRDQVRAVQVCFPGEADTPPPQLIGPSPVRFLRPPEEP